MSRLIKRIKQHEGARLDPDTSLALRELAGWPLQQHHESRSRHRHRSLIVERDSSGRIIGSLEHIEENEHQEQSHDWGK